MTVVGDRVFKEVIKLKLGQSGGPNLNDCCPLEKRKFGQRTTEGRPRDNTGRKQSSPEQRERP